MSGPRYLVVPTDSALDDVRVLLSLDGTALGKLAAVLHSPDTIRTGNPTYELLANEAGLTNREALAALRAKRNLTSQAKRYRLDWEKLRVDLVSLCPSEMGALQPEAEAALRDALTEGDADELHDKTLDLKHAHAPHLVATRTVCDVRPVFDRTPSDIQRFLVLTLLELQTHDGDADEYKKVVVQLGRDDIRELRKALDRAEKKVEIVAAALKHQAEVIS